MKKSIELLAVIVIFFMLAFVAPPSLVGDWQVYRPNNPPIKVTFNKDSTYSAYDNAGYLLVKGNYYENKDTFAMSGGGCQDNYWGKYKLTYFGNDSMSIKVIEDNCDDRKEGADGTTGKRMMK